MNAKAVYTKDGKYHFFIVFCCFLAFSVSVGIGFNCWTVFTIPVCEELNITRAQFGYLFTALQLALTLGGLIAAKVIDKLGLMNYMKLGAVALTVMMFMMSTINSAPAIYIIGFFVGLPMSCNFYLSYSVIVSNWFNKLRGLMTGLIFMGSGLISMAAAPIVQYFTDNAGWRETMMGMAAVTGIVSIPLIFFIIKERPQDVGLLPYGEEVVTSDNSYDDSTDPVFSDILRMPHFWIYSAFIFLLQFQVLHIGTVVPFLTDLGYGAAFSSNVYALCMGMLAVCRIAVGFICDKFGSRKTTVILTVLGSFYMIGMLAATRSPLACLLIIPGQALMQGVTTVTHPILVLDMFGRKEYTKTLGIYSAVTGISGALPSFSYGIIYAMTGSYLNAFKVCLAVHVVAIICMAFVLSHHKKLNA